MTTTTPTRTTPTYRTVRLIAAPDAAGRPLVVITLWGRVTYYRLARLEPGYGERAYTLAKCGGGPTGRYDLLRDNAGHWTCDCPDATFRGNPCKHARSLEALLRAGKLS